MATLTLPGLTVGLPVWLFSNSVVPSMSADTTSVPPPAQHPVEPQVDPTPSTPTSTTPSSPGGSTQVAHKKKKKSPKKKSNKGTVTNTKKATNTTVVPPRTTEDGLLPTPPPKVKFPCRLCKENHLLRDCPGIPRVLGIWACDPARPSPSAVPHGDGTPIVGNSKGNGKIRLPCKLCEGHHFLHLCPLMDKATSTLESLANPPPQLPAGYQRLSAPADCTSTDDKTGSHTSLAQSPLTAPGSIQLIPDQPSVGDCASSSLPSVDQPVPDDGHKQVLHVSSTSESNDDPLIHFDSEGPPPAPFEHTGSYLPRSSAISFDWSHLTSYRLPSHVPFQITVHAYDTALPGTIMDEGASASLMSYTTWQAIGSPPLKPITHTLLAFDGRACQSLGILPQLPITLGGKTVFLDVMVTQNALGNNFLLGRDYIYAMGAIVSSLFRVICFPHNGRIATIDQLSFFSSPLPWSPPSGPPPSVAPASSQVNYVSTFPPSPPSTTHMVNSALGALDSGLHGFDLPLGAPLQEAPPSSSL